MKTKKILFLGPLLLIALSACSLTGSKPAISFGPGGIFKTYDTANTWSQKSLISQIGQARQTIENVNIRKIVFYPRSTKSLYILPENPGFFISHNAGESWEQKISNLGMIVDMAIDPDNRGYVFVLTGDSIYRQEECCDDWTKVYQETRGNILTGIEINPKNSQEIYFTNSLGEVFKSVNHGNSWTVIKRLSIKIIDFVASPNDQNIMYLVTVNGLYKTVNKGIDWNKIEALKDYPGSNEFYQLVFDPAKWDAFFYVTKYGILKTEDGGKSWSAIELLTPPSAVQIYSFTINPQNSSEIIYATAKTLYYTDNSGKNWITKSLPTNRWPSYLLTDPDHPNIIYMGSKLPPQK